MSSNKSVNYSELFEVDNPLTNQYYWVHFAEPEWIECHHMWQLFTGEWQPSEPVVLKAYRGGKPADFLWLGAPPNVFISEKVMDLLLGNQFTGWATYPVKIYGRKGESLPRYQGLAIRSYAGERDLTRSQVIAKPPTVPGAKPMEVYKGLYFDESKWDGTDIFRVDGATKAVTRRVAEAFERAKVTNVHFTPLPEVETLTLIYKVRGAKKQDGKE